MGAVVEDMTTRGLRGVLRFDESMARHTSWRAGGPADRYYEPADLEDLAAFVAGLPADEPLEWIGLGSNLLVRDGGLRGTVIATHGGLDRLELLGPGRVRAEAGVASAKLARFCVNHALAGAEFLAGIPGTVGGALAMNAGAFGSETWSIVEAVETLDRQGTVRRRRAEEYAIGYRSVSGPEGEWFAAGVFHLQAGGPEAGRARIKSLLERRGTSQPIGLPNAGSVFRNPKGDYAARLIEAAGLKSLCEGQACVSEVHANFIINRGGATARDIERLIERLQEAVRGRFGVELEREVRIVGEAS
jgi:UDP-N-acetylmuramate dehydrogenase